MAAPGGNFSLSPYNTSPGDRYKALGQVKQAEAAYLLLAKLQKLKLGPVGEGWMSCEPGEEAWNCKKNILRHPEEI
jgi:hypothetical protein